MMSISFVRNMVGVLLLALFIQSVPPSSLHASHRDEEGRERASAERKAQKLGRKPVKAFIVPVLGVSVSELSDTWGESRTEGRTHEGIDIIAPRGSIVVSPTKAVVVQVGTNPLGGKVVYTANPGGERFYFAHLDRVKKELKVGQVLGIGDVIGYVGNTGNASGTVPHLHFGIYKSGATNPFPRITKRLPPALERTIVAKEVMRAKGELAQKRN
jgi:murein DD-endopeptidase MepM/ murein hydrolase activator NlpD